MKVYGVIYLLIDGTNDMEYVGQTVRSVKQRFKQHAKCKTTYIGRAIKAHGSDMFVIVILKECYSKAELDYWEKHFIKYRDTMAPNGYNLTEGGEGGSPCDETRAKIRAAGKGRKKSPEHRAKIGASERGKKQPHKACEKLSKKHRGETHYNNLLNEMNEKNILYSELAQILGLCHQSVSDKMRGKVKFTRKDIEKLVDFFDKPAEYLLARDDGFSSTTSEDARNSNISITIRQNSLYKNLLREMDNRQMSYNHLAKLMGFSSGTSISLKMHGKQNFTEKDVAKLVEIFGFTAEYLLAKNDEDCAIITTTNRGYSPFKNLLAAMMEQHFTYAALAELLGLSRPTVSCKMRGKTRFTDKDIAKLVEFFGKPEEYLMARDDGK